MSIFPCITRNLPQCGERWKMIKRWLYFKFSLPYSYNFSSQRLGECTFLCHGLAGGRLWVPYSVTAELTLGMRRGFVIIPNASDLKRARSPSGSEFIQRSPLWIHYSRFHLTFSRKPQAKLSSCILINEPRPDEAGRFWLWVTDTLANWFQFHTRPNWGQYISHRDVQELKITLHPRVVFVPNIVYISKKKWTQFSHWQRSEIWHSCLLCWSVFWANDF